LAADETADERDAEAEAEGKDDDARRGADVW
jgi:hypothetical protein